MTTPITDNNTIEIDPLTEAMSVLDSLGGGADDIIGGGDGDDDNMLAFDFAIDSDDDENENENETNNAGHQEVINTNDNTVGDDSTTRNISDFSFGDLDDDTLNLEDIDVDGGITQQQQQQHTHTTPVVVTN